MVATAFHAAKNVLTWCCITLYRTPNNHDQTGCVYIITCMTCLKNKSTVEYIGETHRPLHVRFSEHNKKLTQAELNKVNAIVVGELFVHTGFYCTDC